jgi:hypothetical protein
MVDYVVRLPYSSDVELRGVEGSLQVDRVRGAIDLHTVGGSATLQDLEGQIDTVAVNGSIHVVRVAGSAKLETVNGSISVADSQLEALVATTVNGRITVQVAPDASDYELNTVNGGCHLTLPPDLSARVSAHGVNIKVDCSVPATSVERNLGGWRGVLGNGSGPTAEITVATVNGQLRIGSAETVKEAGATFVAKAAPSSGANEACAFETEPPATNEGPPAHQSTEEAPRGNTQAEILRSVERGELSVQDAITLLEEAHP